MENTAIIFIGLIVAVGVMFGLVPVWLGNCSSGMQFGHGGLFRGPGDAVSRIEAVWHDVKEDICRKDARIAELDRAVAERDAEIARLGERLAAAGALAEEKRREGRDEVIDGVIGYALRLPSTSNPEAREIALALRTTCGLSDRQHRLLLDVGCKELPSVKNEIRGNSRVSVTNNLG